MPYALGVDIGTSTLTTATYRIGDRDDPVVTPIRLEPDGKSSTAVVITDDGRVIVGAAADRESVNRPERLLRGWSRRVGDTVPIAVGDAMIAPESIFAAVARWAVSEATAREGSSPAAVCVSHPSGWGEHRVSLLERALATAGVDDVVVVDEVDAVVEQHRSALGVDGRALGIYDLGADRLTFSLIAEDTGGGWTRLAAETLDGVGGTRFDDAVLAHVIASSTDAFAHFDTMADKSMSDMRALRAECATAKGLLSSQDEVSVPVRLAGSDSSVRIELLDLRAAVEQTVLNTARAVREAHRRADRTEAETAIILVGGSCASPQLRTRLAAELEARLIVDDDPQLTVASGAARIAAARVDWSIPDAPTAQPSGSESARAMVARAYSTVISALGSAARKGTLPLKRRAAPEPAPAAAGDDPTSRASVAESEFDRLIAPDRSDGADDVSPSRDRSAERTEVAR